MPRTPPAPEIVELHEAYVALWQGFADQFRAHTAGVEALARKPAASLHELLREAYWTPSHFLRHAAGGQKANVGSAPGFFFEHLGATAIAARLKRLVPGLATCRNKLPAELDAPSLPPCPDLIAYNPVTRRAAVFEFKATPSVADLAGVALQRQRHIEYKSESGETPVAFFLVGGRVGKRQVDAYKRDRWAAFLRCAIDDEDEVLDTLPRVDELAEQAAVHLLGHDITQQQGWAGLTARLFDGLPPAQVIPRTPPVVPVVREDGRTECTCGGTNPDCLQCGGRGDYITER